jgi:hypothetical protein
MQFIASDASTLILLALVAAVAAMFLRGVSLAGRAASGSAASAADSAAPRVRSHLPIAAAVLAAWMLYSGVMAAKGLLLDPTAVPPPVVRVLVPGLLLAAFAAFSPLGTRLAKYLGYASLIGFHAFRIPLEGLLWWFHHQGRLPVQMTFEGRNFDILTGLSAVAVAVLAKRGLIGPRAALAWNLAGFALLLNIMGVAVLSIPGPLQMFHDEPANTLVLHFPYVWIPAVFVLAAFFGHLVLFRKIRMRS